jgi:hypothetical protein
VPFLGLAGVLTGNHLVTDRAGAIPWLHHAATRELIFDAAIPAFDSNRYKFLTNFGA